MEKYGQYRDKGSGIAPFFPIAPPPSNLVLAPYHLLLFCLRIPLLIFAWAVWLLIIQWTTAGSLLRKANLWCILGIPGVWWIDIRVDGVQRGSLGKGGSMRLPGPGTIIASSYTSPLDVLYLAAIFDPIFTQSYQGSRKVRPLSLEGALAACFSLTTSPEQTIELSQLVAQNPQRVIVVFPESTTSNGRGVLHLSPSLLSAPKSTSIYPVSLRYTPADVVTPIPGWMEALRFIWKLCSRQTHCIRVRVGLPMTLAQQHKAAEQEVGREASRGREPPKKYDTNFFDSFQSSESDDAEGLKPAERRSLDLIAESLSRLGRAKTLGLGIEEKIGFVNAWMGKSKKRR
ncbi:related to vacuolar sorting Vps66 [Lecanosticta acicola]|uniref:Related to vacuolar sorting Vps66 n=1 Tax=Lecanosticta acicola TaxID=111012 RepID=A0AAI9EA68_9PEZI|nr:related to vacuolar sorting Vps66 [Lecanosticta acicola]